MKRYAFLIVVPVLFLAGCSKSDSGASSATPPPEPKRNMSESLGFVSADTDSYTRNPPPAAAAPDKKTVSNTTITRTLTGKDGRTVDAVLLSRTEISVKIRRRSDWTEFTIPFDKLSEADRTFIRQSALPLTPGS